MPDAFDEIMAADPDIVAMLASFDEEAVAGRARMLEPEPEDDLFYQDRDGDRLYFLARGFHYKGKFAVFVYAASQDGRPVRTSVKQLRVCLDWLTGREARLERRYLSMKLNGLL